MSSVNSKTISLSVLSTTAAINAGHVITSGDSSAYTLEVTFTDVTTISGTCQLHFVLGDGTYADRDDSDGVTVAGNKVTYLLPEAVYSVSGLVCYVQFLNSNIFTPLKISFSGIRALPGGVPTASLVSYPAWVTSVASAEALRVIAENARVVAENARLANEGDAGSGRVKAEADRIIAEGLRVTADGSRTTAEGLRVTAEAGRVIAENARAAAEGDTGSGRVKAEADRIIAEGLRVTADGSRTTAEGLRVTAEAGRVIAENARVSAENSRVTAESRRAAWHASYDAGHAYLVGEKVSYNGSSYICILDSTGNLPTNATYYKLIASKGDKGDTGAQGPIGNVMYATFDIDFDTGELVMTIPDGYTGPTFAINNETGELEVSI